ncbi:unnamed protein product [Penicillium nalgiovense]|nr:unnamed protein product [Penicillium nalgiovense]
MVSYRANGRLGCFLLLVEQAAVMDNPCVDPSELGKARQKGFSVPVTHLYLEELTRSRGHNLSLPAVSASSEASSVDHNPSTDGRTDTPVKNPALVPRLQELSVFERLGHTVRLVLRDDGKDASPPIMDAMQIAAQEDAVNPGIDQVGFITEDAPTHQIMKAAAHLDTSHKLTTGVGVSINAHAFSKLPHLVPPPSLSTKPRKVNGESQTGHQIHVSTCYPRPNGTSPALDGATNSIGSSEVSSFQHQGFTHSPQAVDSSATSLAPFTKQCTLVESRESPSPEQRRLKKRRLIIKELIDTEHSYGEDMRVVNDIYKATSSSCLGFSVDDIKTLFANSDQVAQFSITFQHSLKEATKSVYSMPKSQRWRSKCSNRNLDSGSAADDDQYTVGESIPGLEKDRSTSLGIAFMTHMTQMEVVNSGYLKNHDAANKKLQTLQSNPEAAIWMKECRESASDLTCAWDLDSLLAKPVQRILKYPLFLTELLESTPIDHPDHGALFCALQKVKKISVRINGMKKRADFVDKVVGRKYKGSDARAGLSKAFGRRTENPSQQVGLSDKFEDKVYGALVRRFGDEYFQLQLVLRDVEEYIQEAENFMTRFNKLIAAMEETAEVAQFNYQELESK